MNKITYTNKVDTRTTETPEINKVTASTLNEVKTIVNETIDQVELNVTAIALNTTKVSYDSASSTRLANTSGTNTGDQDLSVFRLITDSYTKTEINTLDTQNVKLTGNQSNIAGDKTFTGNLSASVFKLTGNSAGLGSERFIGTNGDSGFRYNVLSAKTHNFSVGGSDEFRIGFGLINAYDNQITTTGNISALTLTPTAITTGNIPYKSAGELLDSPISTDGTNITLASSVTANGTLIANNTVGKGVFQIKGSQANVINYEISNAINGIDNAGLQLINLNSNTKILYFNSSNVATFVSSITATAFNTSSDYRLKEDSKDFNGLEMICNIPVYDYKWKADESRAFGVMAHELQEVLPQAVTSKKDGKEMQAVDYSKIVPLLIKSIQELTAKIEVLENK